MCLDRDDIGGSCFGVTDASRLRPMPQQYAFTSPSRPNRETIFSPDRFYRYTLWREWSAGKGYVNFIGLNPSTADETKNDPTIRKCIGFAKRWGFQALCMTNLFAYRSTDPRGMKGYSKPIGPENDKYLVRCARDADVVVAAWGKHGAFMARDVEIWKLIDELHCLKTNGDGSPQHPLYIPYDSAPDARVLDVWSPQETF